MTPGQRRMMLVLLGGAVLPLVAIPVTWAVFYFSAPAGLGWLGMLCLPVWAGTHWLLSRRFDQTYPARKPGIRTNPRFRLLTTLVGGIVVVFVGIALWLAGPDLVASLLRLEIE